MSEITCYCEGCGQKYRAPAESAGTQFECQTCATPVLAPLAVDLVDESLEFGESVEPMAAEAVPLEEHDASDGPHPPALPARDRACAFKNMTFKLSSDSSGDAVVITRGTETQRVPLDWIEKAVAVPGDTAAGFAGKLAILIPLVVLTAGCGIIIAFFLGLSFNRRYPTIIFALKNRPAIMDKYGDMLAYDGGSLEELNEIATLLETETRLKVERH